jgi:hypothetical protein
MPLRATPRIPSRSFSRHGSGLIHRVAEKMNSPKFGKKPQKGTTGFSNSRRFIAGFYATFVT